MKTQMPKINLAALTLDEREGAIVARIIKSDGTLRASKPPVPKMVRVADKDSFFGSHFDHSTEDGRIAGEAAYVWRMVAFQISPRHQHQCMPCTQDSDMGGRYEERRQRTGELDALVSDIVDAVDPREWHGVKRWGQALGLIGEPVIRENGTIVYR